MPAFTFGTGAADHFIRLCIRQMYLHAVINCRTSEYETCRCHIDVHVSSCNNVRPHLPRMHYQKYQNVYQQMHSRKYADFSLLHTNTNMYRPLFSATRRIFSRAAELGFSAEFQISRNTLQNKKYVLWNVDLPNASTVGYPSTPIKFNDLDLGQFNGIQCQSP